MFHLFSKVYLASDSTINLNFDRVVISERYGIGMYEALDKVSYGELFAYGKTIDSVLGEKTFGGFIESLLEKINESDKKLVIYVDDNNLSKFISLWFKSIFVNPTAESSWKIIDAYVKKEKILKNWRYSSTSTDSDIFSGMTKDKFELDFSETETHTIANITELLSFEFLVATYLANGENITPLKQSLSNILMRSVQEFIIEMKHTFIKNYNKPNFPVMPVDVSYFKESTLYTTESLGRVSSSSNLNILGASEEDILLFKEVARKILIEWDEYKETADMLKRIDYIDYVRQELSDEQVDELIDIEKNSLCNNRIYSSADEEKINLYFLDFILNSNTEDLSSYILK
jgi:hypothetical protein